MIKIVKKKINMSDELKAKIKWSCNFNKQKYENINKQITKLNKDKVY